MGAISEMHERLNAIRLRGETPISYELDHEEFYRLLEALKPLMRYPSKKKSKEKANAHSYRDDDIVQLFFEGVYIINKG